jgi:outer membrane protein assembly factor BamD
MYRFTKLFFILPVILLLASCSGYEKALKSKDPNLKLTAANKFYDKKKYQQANGIYETLIPILTHTRNAEPLYYRYAWSFYYMKDYLSASYYFKNFADMFPGSKDADECEYMYGVSLYKMSPKPSLDPTNTQKALEALQSYINTHPGSKHLDEANNYVINCLQKMEEKEAAAAKLYYNIGQYKSAGIAYKSVLRNYPESAKGDEYQYMIQKAWYKYANESFPEKQEERFAASMNAYLELKDGYPKSKYLHDAEKYHTLAANKVKTIRNEHK